MTADQMKRLILSRSDLDFQNRAAQERIRAISDSLYDLKAVTYDKDKISGVGRRQDIIENLISEKAETEKKLKHNIEKLERYSKAYKMLSPKDQRTLIIWRQDGIGGIQRSFNIKRRAAHQRLENAVKRLTDLYNE